MCGLATLTRDYEQFEWLSKMNGLHVALESWPTPTFKDNLIILLVGQYEATDP